MLEGTAISAIVGLVTGALGSLVAPWANWGVEKRRRKLDRRQQLVDHWREILASENFDRSQIVNDPTYGVLKQLLSGPTRSQIERPTNSIIVARSSVFQDADTKALHDEIASIERRWGLI